MSAPLLSVFRPMTEIQAVSYSIQCISIKISVHYRKYPTSKLLISGCRCAWAWFLILSTLCCEGEVTFSIFKKSEKAYVYAALLEYAVANYWNRQRFGVLFEKSLEFSCPSKNCQNGNEPKEAVECVSEVLSDFTVIFNCFSRMSEMT